MSRVDAHQEVTTCSVHALLGITSNKCVTVGLNMISTVHDREILDSFEYEFKEK